MHPFLATFVASVASVAPVASIQYVLLSLVPVVGALGGSLDVAVMFSSNQRLNVNCNRDVESM